QRRRPYHQGTQQCSANHGGYHPMSLPPTLSQSLESETTTRDVDCHGISPDLIEKSPSGLSGTCLPARPQASHMRIHSRTNVGVHVRHQVETNAATAGVIEHLRLPKMANVPHGGAFRADGLLAKTGLTSDNLHSH